jgi:phenylalanyl-tRNA synthetase beta chain
MKLSMKWLSDYVDVHEFFSEPEKLAARLTAVGIEVEGIDDLGKKYQKVVIGKILEKDVHPHADRLSLCQVDVGDGKNRQIVCGATNHQQGDKVVVALPGAVLPGDFEIKLSKIRQIESQGMLCSEVELGLAKESPGIMILPGEAPLGTSFADYRGLNDVIFELSVTPNRADCLSHLGLAREVGALLGRNVHQPSVELKEAKGDSTRERVKLEIKNTDLCPRYAGRGIFGVKVGPSPDWLKSRLEKVGINSINNVVDVTNYVMLEFGQPLHAFDLSLLRNKTVIVDEAIAGEKFISLDGTELEFSGEELVIRDGAGPVALAGIVGGVNSGVKEATCDLFIESAYFLRESVRKTARKWGIDTDSSYRFSRGTDPEGVLRALNRACLLILDVAGGSISKDFYDAYPQPFSRRPIAIRHEYLEERLGYPVQNENFEKWMKRIGCQIRPSTEGGWQVQPPPYRWDLDLAIDLVEEYARFEGYDQIPEVFPPLVESPSTHAPQFKLENRLNDWIAAEGYLQVVNYGFFSSQGRADFIGDPTNLNSVGLATPPDGVKVRNPLNDETNEMRVSLLPGLLKNLVSNFRQGMSYGRLFETGFVFYRTEKAYKEEARVALVGWGQPKNIWASGGGETCPTVYSLKASIENIFSKLLIASYQWRKLSSENAPSFIHPGQAVGLFVEGKMIGVLGTLHPLLAQQHKLRTSVALAEFTFEGLVRGQPRVPKAKAFSRFPSVERDLAFLVPSSVDAGEILKEIRKQSGSLLEDASIFDVYAGGQLGEGMRSVAYRMVFRDSNGTLNETQLVELQNKLADAVKKKYKLEVR